VFLDGRGQRTGEATLWNADVSPGVYRVTSFREETDHEERWEGGLISDANLGHIAYDRLHSAPAGVPTLLHTRGRSDTTQVRVAPDTVETWTTTTELSPGGVISTTSVSDSGRYRKVTANPGARTVVTKQDNGVVSTEKYDAFGRLSEVILPGGESQRQFFDEFGRLARIERGSVQRTFSYSQGTFRPECVRTTSAVGAEPESVCTEWREDGLPKQITYQTPTPCRNSHLTGDDGERKLVFEYDRNLDLSGIRGRGFYREPAYDAEGRLYSQTLHFLRPGVKSYSKPADEWGQATSEIYYDWNGDISTKRSGAIVWDTNPALPFMKAKTGFNDARVVARDRYGWPSLLSVGSANDMVQMYVSREEGRTVYSLTSGEKIVFEHKDRLRTIDSVRALSRDGHVLYALATSPDAAGRIKSEGVTIGGAAQTLSYAYDGNRLRRADVAGASFEYEHTPSGLLRVRKDASGTTQIDRKSGSITSGANAWQLDGFGRVRAHEGNDICWSAGNQVQTVAGPDKQTRAEYYYDESGLRILSATWDASGQPHLEARIGALVATDSAVTSSLSLGGHLVGTLDASGWHPTVFDARNSNRTARQEGLSILGPYGERSEPRAAQAWPDFVSGSYEPTLKMIRLGHRDYIPEAGQFAQPDQLFLNSLERCAASPIQCNLYGYTAADPVNFADPDGLLQCMTLHFRQGSNEWSSTICEGGETGGFSAGPSGPMSLGGGRSGRGGRGGGTDGPVGPGGPIEVSPHSRPPPRLPKHAPDAIESWDPILEGLLWFCGGGGFRNVARFLSFTKQVGASGGGTTASSSSIDAARLAMQLAFEEASGAFTDTGELSETAIQGAREIIPEEELINPELPEGFSKFQTETFESPSGPFHVHFYKNSETGEVFYGQDFKAIFSGEKGPTYFTPYGGVAP
jgi:RHS repeat-associated protein